MSGTLTANEQAVAPSTPSTGQRKIYPKSDGWYEMDDAGVETKMTNIQNITNNTYNVNGIVDQSMVAFYTFAGR